VDDGPCGIGPPRNSDLRVSSPTKKPSPLDSSLGSFVAGMRASVFTLVLLGTYVGIGALAHDYGFSIGWVLLSTVLVWAGPAQVIIISALGSGATPLVPQPAIKTLPRQCAEESEARIVG
jgi:hypothetical protein